MTNDEFEIAWKNRRATAEEVIELAKSKVEPCQAEHSLTACDDCPVLKERDCGYWLALVFATLDRDICDDPILKERYRKEAVQEEKGK